MKNRLLLTLATLVLGYASAFSQLSQDSIFESRCAQSGRVHYTYPGSSMGATFEITSSPAVYTATGPQSIGDFYALPPGAYTISYLDGPTSATDNFVIAGTYVDPTLGIDTVIDAYCPGSGEIHVSFSEGRLPYRYRLLHRDSAAGAYQPWQASGVYTGLRAGTYEIQAEDSCGVLKTVSNIVVDYPNGGPLGYDFNGQTGVYNSDEATSFPTSCTETTVAMMLRRNYAFRGQTGLMWDGNGVAVTDHLDPNQVPLSLTGGVAPYTYRMLQTEAHSFLQPLTDTFNDLRPGPVHSSVANDYGSTAEGRGIVFDVANDLILYSVGLRGSNGGYNVKITLKDSAGVVLHSKWEEQDQTNGNDNVASLGWSIPAGTGYELIIDFWRRDNKQ